MVLTHQAQHLAYGRMHGRDGRTHTVPYTVDGLELTAVYRIRYGAKPYFERLMCYVCGEFKFSSFQVDTTVGSVFSTLIKTIWYKC